LHQECTTNRHFEIQNQKKFLVTLPMTLSAPELPQTTPFSSFCTAIHSFATDEPRDFKFGTLIASPTLLMKNFP